MEPIKDEKWELRPSVQSSPLEGYSFGGGWTPFDVHQPRDTARLPGVYTSAWEMGKGFIKVSSECLYQLPAFSLGDGSN